MCVSLEGFDEVMASLVKKLLGSSKLSEKVPFVTDISGPADLRHEVHVRLRDGILQGLPESWQTWLQTAKFR